VSKPQILLPPFCIEIDGTPIEILEIIKHQLITGETQYTVALRIRYKGITSKIFSITVKSIEELKNKLKIELTKIRFMELTYGLKYVESVIK